MNSPGSEEDLFQAAVPLTGTERAAFLNRECAGDPALRARLEALLDAHDQTDTLFGTETGRVRPTISPDCRDLADDLVGQTIGRYKLLEKLGEGGCGVVYVAEQTEPMRRRVALKIIKLGMDTKQVVARFDAERQALAMMDHPNIAKVLDAGTTGASDQSSVNSDQSPGGGRRRTRPEPLMTDNCSLITGYGRPYFVMELVRGIKITDYCDRNLLSTRERLDLFIKACHAIQHAHQKGIIHRDIKPSNILVTLQDGVAVPKVIDFGIAKAVEGRLTDATVYTQLHQFIGTPAYMSPEQAEMSALDIDTRTDIYSLGVLLYELLTGTTPFDAKELMSHGIDAMRRTIREEEPVRPSTRLTLLRQEQQSQSPIANGQGQTAQAKSQIRNHKSEIETDLDWIVMKCLEKDRGRRYETANGLAVDLQRHLTNEPVVARPPSAAYRFRKSWRRNRLAYTAALAMMVTLVAGLVVSVWQFRVADRAREDSEQAWGAERQQRQLVQEERDRAVLARRAADEQRQVAEDERRRTEAARQAVVLERDRAARLLSRSQAEQGVRRLEAGDPAGLLLLIEARRTVEHLAEERLARTLMWNAWFQDLPAREMITLQTTRRLHTLDYSLAGPWLVTGAEDGEVILWPPHTGRQFTTIQTHVPHVSILEMSADGHLLLVSNGSETQLWNLALPNSQTSHRLLVANILHYAFDPTRRRVVLLARGQPTGRAEPQPRPDAPLDATATRREVQVWETGPEARHLTTWPDDRRSLANHSFALSPDGTVVVTLRDTLEFWDGRDGGRLGPALEPEPMGVQTGSYWAFFSPNGRWLWALTRHQCQRYDAASRQPLGEPVKGTVQFPRQGRAESLLVLEQGGATRLLHLDTADYLGPAIHREAPFSSPFLSADGRWLASERPDGSIRFWETRTGEPAAPPVFPPLQAVARSLSPNGEWLATITSDGLGRLYKVVPSPSDRFAHKPGVRVLGFNAAGECLQFNGPRRSFAWIHPGSDTVSTREGQLPDGTSLLDAALTPNGREVATALRSTSGEVRIHVFDAATFEIVRKFPQPTQAAHLAMSPDGNWLAGIAATTGNLEIWDSATGERRHHFLWPGAAEFEWYGVQFSPDGRFLAAWNIHGFAIWDVASGRLGNGAAWDFHTAISPDWRLAFNRDGLVDLRDPLRPRPSAAPLPPEALQNSGGVAAFSPDGRWLALAMRSNRLRVFDTTTGTPLRNEVQTSGQAYHVAFSPDGRLLVTHEIDLREVADRNRNVRLWDVATGLALGDPQPVTGFLSQWRFDRSGRWLSIGQQPVEGASDSWIWHLPDSRPQLEDMERWTWLRTGCRLDEAGHVELLTPAELEELGRSPDGVEKP